MMHGRAIGLLSILLAFLMSVSTLEAQSRYGLPDRSRNSENPLRGMDPTGSNSQEFQQMIETRRQQLIENYVEPIEEEIEDAIIHQEVINGLVDRLNRLHNVAKSFWDLERGAFMLLNAESSDPDAFTATATRQARPGEHSIEVLELAQADNLNSDAISAEAALPAGTFTISSGEDSVDVEFNGGTLFDLADAINDVADPLLARAFAISVDGRNDVLNLAGLKPGVDNSLRFSGDTAPLAAAGLLGGAVAPEDLEPRSYPLISANTDVIAGDDSPYTLTDENALILQYGAQVDVPLMLPEPVTGSTRLRLQVRAEEAEGFLDLLNRGDFGVGTIDDLEIHTWVVISEPLVPVLPGTGGGRTDRFLKMQMDGEATIVDYAMPEAGANGEWVTMELPLGDDLEGIANEAISLRFYNSTYGRILSVRQLELVYEDEPTETPTDANGEALQGKNYRSTATDARLRVNGVEIRRPTNLVERAIRGVTITLKGRTEDEETLDIGENIDGVMMQVGDLVGAYNVVVAYIYNVTKYVPERSAFEEERRQEELERMTPEELDYYYILGRDREGQMGGDQTFQRIQIALRQAFTQPYETSLGPRLSHARQVGIDAPGFDQISTNENELDERLIRASRWLDVDQDLFQEQLELNYTAMKELFYNDLDDDYIFESGIAGSLSALAKEYASQRVTVEELNQTMDGVLYAMDRRLHDRLENRMSGLRRVRLPQALDRVERELDDFRQQLITIGQSQRELEASMRRQQQQQGFSTP